MHRTHKLIQPTCVLVAIGVFVPIGGSRLSHAGEFAAAVAPSARAVVWEDRGDVRLLNVYYGAGGKKNQPAGELTFVKEEWGGTSPKFRVVDQQGISWIAKLGKETRSETAATRLVWAAGYFTDEDYYLPEVRVHQMRRLRRGRQYVAANGVVYGVRLERLVKGQIRKNSWSWFHNPLVGTKEFNGLRVMMALLNNWDLKKANNAVCQERPEEARYVVTDLGATFGRTGNSFVRSKSKLQDYRKAKFVQRVRAKNVDFFLGSRPFFLTVVHIRNYVKRTKMQEVAKDIPREDARWLGNLLGQLSSEQIRDCFRAAGYALDEVDGFAAVVEQRIADLQEL